MGMGLRNPNKVEEDDLEEVKSRQNRNRGKKPQAFPQFMNEVWLMKRILKDTVALKPT